jgi:hypothetical protein
LPDSDHPTLKKSLYGGNNMAAVHLANAVGGNVFLGGKEAVGDQCVYTKNIGAVLSIIDKKSF